VHFYSCAVDDGKYYENNNITPVITAPRDYWRKKFQILKLSRLSIPRSSLIFSTSNPGYHGPLCTLNCAPPSAQPHLVMGTKYNNNIVLLTQTTNIRSLYENLIRSRYPDDVPGIGKRTYILTLLQLSDDDDDD